MKNFLLEIGTEELPAAFVEAARKQLEIDARRLFADKRLDFKDMSCYASCRRIALLAEGLAAEQQEIRLRIPGPSRKTAYDDKGKPGPALEGFARKQGVEVKDIVIDVQNGEERVFAVKAEKGAKTVKILPEMVKDLITGMHFPKKMKWPQSDFQFARPVRWITMVFNGKPVKAVMGGLKADNKTMGHKSISIKPVIIKDAEKYEKALKDNHVIIDQDERKKIILRSIQSVLGNAGGILLEDEDLLCQVNYLVEFPTPVLGHFDAKYLCLPQAVLITCMKHHQKYFSVVDKNGGLKPCFVGIRDGISVGMKNVQEGYERVLKARLEDAEFFFRRDTSKKLDDYNKELENVVFQADSGTLEEKVGRIRALSAYLVREARIVLNGGDDNLMRAIRLCKADLMTQMVKEYPEMQGVMGREYAKLSGETDTVAQAIYEHYLPLAVTGKLPETTEGAIMSIADKIDTISCDFAASRIPTGSSDPYGLRKQAHGVVRILMEKLTGVSAGAVIEESLNQLKITDSSRKNDLKGQLLKFLRQRVEAIFENGGMKYDEVKAVLDTGFDFIYEAKRKVEAISGLRKLPDFEPIAAAFKRAKNILNQAEVKFNIKPDGLILKPGELVEKEEKQLYSKFSEIRAEVEGQLCRREYESALKKLVGLRQPVDEFFLKVMVMDKSEALRNNRLALLKDIIKLFLKLADFSQIVVAAAVEKKV